MRESPANYFISSEFRPLVLRLHSLDVPVVVDAVGLEVERRRHGLHHVVPVPLQVSDGLVEGLGHPVRLLHSLDGVGGVAVHHGLELFKLGFPTDKILYFADAAGNPSPVAHPLIPLLARPELQREPIQRSQLRDLGVRRPQRQQPDLLRKLLNQNIPTAMSGSANIGTCPTISCTMSGSGV